MRLAPVIRTVQRALAGARRVEAVRMTGSGTAVFALFPHRQDAVAAVGRLRRRHPGWWLRAASFLTREAAGGRIRCGGGRSGSYRSSVRR